MLLEDRQEFPNETFKVSLKIPDMCYLEEGSLWRGLKVHRLPDRC